MPSRYAEVHVHPLSDPESFRAEAEQAIHWTKRRERVLDDSNPPSYRWFTGGELDTCYNALDLHGERSVGKRGREAPAETPFVAAVETDEEGHHSEACPCGASDSTDAGTATQVALGSSGNRETFCAELHAHARFGGHPADAHRSRAGAGDADSETRRPTALRA